MSLDAEIAAALALAVLDVGADVVATDADGFVVARGGERVRLELGVQRLGGPPRDPRPPKAPPRRRWARVGWGATHEDPAASGG